MQNDLLPRMKQSTTQLSTIKIIPIGTRITRKWKCRARVDTTNNTISIRCRRRMLPDEFIPLWRLLYRDTTSEATSTCWLAVDKLGQDIRQRGAINYWYPIWAYKYWQHMTRAETTDNAFETTIDKDAIENLDHVSLKADDFVWGRARKIRMILR